MVCTGRDRGGGSRCVVCTVEPGLIADTFGTILKHPDYQGVLISGV